MFKRAGVMQPQAFNIDHFEPRFTDLRADHRNVWQLTIRKNVALNKLTRAAPNLTAIGVFSGNPMVHHQATFAHSLGQDVAVLT